MSDEVLIAEARHPGEGLLTDIDMAQTRVGSVMPLDLDRTLAEAAGLVVPERDKDGARGHNDVEEELRRLGAATTARPDVGAETMTAPAGIPNMGNTCYASAIMQCLFQVAKEVRTEVERKGEVREQGPHDPVLVARAVMDVGSEWQLNINGRIEPSSSPVRALPDILARIYGSHERGKQQDAGDFLQKVLRGFSELLTRREGRPLDAFVGVQVERLRKCGRCGNVRGQRSELWSTINVQLPMQGADFPLSAGCHQGQATRLDSLLKSSRQNSRLAALKCDVCGCVNNKPGDQIIDMHEWKSFADTVIVAIQIFKQAYTAEGAPFHTKDDQRVLCPQFMWIHKSLYELRGMVCHEGESCMSGHYTALVKSRTDQRWYICDDATVTPWQGDTTGRGSFSSVMGGGTPYLLFFRKAGKDTQAKGEMIHNKEEQTQDGTTPRHNDSPETRGTVEDLRRTPKRQQHFPPQACKMCGMYACAGECTQCL